MKHKSDPGKIGYLITAFIMMVIAITIQAAWIWVWYFSSLDTAEKKTDFYLSLFPAFLQKSSVLGITAFLFSALAFIFSTLSIKKVRKGFRWMAIICIVLSIAAAFLSVYQLL